MARSSIVGEAVYDARIDTSNLKRDAAKVESTVSSAGSKLSGKMAMYGKMAGAAAAAGIIFTAGKMLSSGGELEQQLGGAEAVFGKFADRIKDKSKSSYKEAGLSQSEYLQGANKMASLYQGAGLSVEKSLDLSVDAMQRASDVASVMGISTQEALEAVTGAAKGNFTMMDNLGVKMTATSLSQEAVQRGLGKTYDQMTEGEKVLLAQQVFLDKTTKYAGNYAKENDTLAGSLNTTRKAFSDWMSGGGSAMNFVNSGLETLDISISNLADRVGIGSEKWEQLKNTVSNFWNNSVVPMIEWFNSNMLPTLEKVWGMVGTNLKNAWDDTMAAIKPLLPVLKIFAAVLGVTVVTGITAAALALSAIARVIASVSRFVIGLGATIARFVSSAVGSIAGFAQRFIGFFSSASRGAKDAMGSLVSWFSGLPGKILGFVSDFGSLLKDAGWSLMKGLLNGIVDGFNEVKDFVGGIAGKIADLKGPLPYDRKVLIDNGLALMFGLDQGIKSGANDVYKTVSKIAPTIGNISGVKGNTGGQGSSTSGRSVSPTYNIYNQTDMDVANRDLAYRIGAPA